MSDKFRKDDFSQACDSRPADANLERLHSFSDRNRFSYGGSATAGCFYCCEIWEPSNTVITEFIDCYSEDEIGNATILCPFCSIDSVITSIDAGEITEELLTAMNEYWF